MDPLQSGKQAEVSVNMQMNVAAMIELAHNKQYFQATFQKLSRQASRSIKIDPGEALAYLREAQKILEYVASCGMNINKQMIMFILHNQASCYQQLWDLQKCSNYLQALIYNISSYLQTNTPTPIQQIQQLVNTRKTDFQYSQNFRGKPYNTRIQLSEYHLQFCAINSESGNHSFAKKSARQAIVILKDIFEELNDQVSMQSLTEREHFKNSENAGALKIIGGISRFPPEFRISKRGSYIETVKHYIQQWTNRKQQDNCKLIKETLKKFSIGHIMKIRFLEEGEYNIEKKSGFYSLFSESYQNESVKRHDRESEQLSYIDNLSIINVTHKVLLLAIGYFTFATELRLSAIELYGNNKEKLKNIQEYKESQIYTLISMIILLIYVPYDMLLIKHIFTSYTTNYRDIFAEADSLQTDNILKHEFDSQGFGQFRIEERSSEMTQIYHKKSTLTEFTDEMKTVNFTMFNRDTRRESHTNISQNNKSKSTKIHVIHERKKPTSGIKHRAKSETLKRYSIPNNAASNVNLNFNDHQKTSSIKPMQSSKKRSLTSLKTGKFTDKTTKSKVGKKQKKKQQVQQEYFEKRSPQPQHFKKKIKSPQCPLRSPAKIKKMKSLNKVLSPQTKHLKLKKK